MRSTILCAVFLVYAFSTIGHAASTTLFPLGTYVGQPDDSSIASQAKFATEYASFANLMGTTPQFLDYFLDDSQDITLWISNAQWAAGSAASSLAQTAVPVIALPLTTRVDGLSVDQHYQAFASGQYDAMLQGVVRTWAQKRFTTQYWRVGWEMNIPSMPSYAGTDTQTQSDWIAAFQHVSAVLHQAGADNGTSVQVVWNPTATNYDTLGVLRNLYPGNSYVDVIGADIYADAYPYSDGNNAAGQATYYDWSTGGEDTSLALWLANPVNRTHYWSYPAANKWGLDGSSGHSMSLQVLLDFAKAQGKPFAIPETGAGNAGGGHGVADDGAFPNWLAQTLYASGNSINFVNLWDSNSGGNFDFSSATAAKPQEAVAWASALGAGSLPDTLTISVSEDAYNGDAQFTVSVDGQQLGSALTATASHAAGQTATMTFTGSFGMGAHTVAVTFLNDAYSGIGQDRNLYLDGVSFNGTAVLTAPTALDWNQTTNVSVPASP